MTIAEFLKQYPKIEIEILLEHVLKKPKEFLYNRPYHQLKPSEIKKLHTLIKRRQKDEPIAYILGYKYFYELKFKVSRDTLIPRPETEWLVERAIETANKLRAKNYKLKILDMGTGSGCIAITLAKLLPKQEIHAADISTKALKIAKTNARSHKVNIKLIQTNLFSKISEKYDLIIANLPYVPIRDYKKLIKNLKYEPKSAITDNTNSNALIIKFLKQLPNYLNPHGIALLEVDPNFPTIPDLTFYKDLNNLTRYAIKNPPL